MARAGEVAFSEGAEAFFGPSPALRILDLGARDRGHVLGGPSLLPLAPVRRFALPCARVASRIGVGLALSPVPIWHRVAHSEKKETLPNTPTVPWALGALFLPGRTRKISPPTRVPSLAPPGLFERGQADMMLAELGAMVADGRVEFMVFGLVVGQVLLDPLERCGDLAQPLGDPHEEAEDRAAHSKGRQDKDGQRDPVCNSHDCLKGLEYEEATRNRRRRHLTVPG